MGFTLLGKGDLERAERLFRDGLTLGRERERQRIADSLEGLAEVALLRAESGTEAGGPERQVQLRRAALLLGAAEAARLASHTVIRPVRKPARDRLLGVVRTHLGAGEFEKAYSEGRSMSLEEAVALA
jgi:hypothetical protein